MRITRYAVAVAVALLVPVVAHAYYQGQTSAVVYCPGVDESSGDPMPPGGSVMQVIAQQDGGANDDYCLGTGGAFDVAGGSCAPIAITFSGTNSVGGIWEKSGVTMPSDADAIKVTCDASDQSAQAITYVRTLHPADPDTRLENIDTLLASLCQADGRHFTISGTPTDTEFDTDYSAPDDFGLSDSPGLSAYVWILYANGDVDAGRLADITNANGHMTLSTALSSGAPSSGDEGCLSIGVNP